MLLRNTKNVSRTYSSYMVTVPPRFKKYSKNDEILKIFRFFSSISKNDQRMFLMLIKVLKVFFCNDTLTLNSLLIL